MSANWKTGNIPSQKGKLFLVTGANSGLGLGTTKELVKKGAKVVMAVRNLEKGKTALKEVLKESPNADLELMQMDLSDFNSVKKFAADFKKKYSKLDVLINNAGVMMPVKRFETKQGFEGQFGTNHLGHFVLTEELFDVIDNTPNSRIVTLSSLAATMKKADIYYDDLQFEKSYDTEAAYAQSKLANMMFGVELDKRLKEKNSKVLSIIAHPGVTATNLQRHMGFKGKIIKLFFAQKVEMGILPTLRVATDPNVKGGEYYGPTKMGGFKGYPLINELNPQASNRATTQKLWDVSEQLTQTKFL